VFTFTNIAYQGSYPRELLNSRVTRWLYTDQLDTMLKLLKAVWFRTREHGQPTYAREIKPGVRCGLEALHEFHWKLSGS